MRYPEFEEWDDAENTLFRRFKLHSYDYESLQRIVREANPNPRGNDVHFVNSLLGKLESMRWEQYYLEQNKRNNPRTYRIRYKLRLLVRWYHRKFKTEFFKQQIQLCNIARAVVKRNNLKKGK